MIKNALKLTGIDNVATALQDINAGDIVNINDSEGVKADSVEALSGIQRGHKIALADIAADEKVIKYGHCIGIASKEIYRGMHVHTHNLSSARGRGDL